MNPCGTPAMWETWVQSLGWEDLLEKGRLPTPTFWPGKFHALYSPWSRRVRCDWATFTSLDMGYLRKMSQDWLQEFWPNYKVAIYEDGEILVWIGFLWMWIKFLWMKWRQELGLYMLPSNCLLKIQVQLDKWV